MMLRFGVCKDISLTKKRCAFYRYSANDNTSIDSLRILKRLLHDFQ